MKHIILGLLFLIFTFVRGQNNYNCFTVLAGKNATEDGSVLLAHNEDDGGEHLVNFFKTKHIESNTPEEVQLRRGATMKLPAELYSLLWLEMPGMEFSDSYQNEYGITIVSDGCPSREDRKDFTGGGIGYWLRRAMALQAKTAREAIQIAGRLIEKYGYASSGRTYCIAGPSEAWMLSVVQGRHWVAQRIPDDEVAIIPNYYTIGKINLHDSLNFLASPDIIEYARQRRWFSGSDEDFNFREAYGQAGNLKDSINIVRHWGALHLLAKKDYRIDEPFPFSCKPKHLLRPEDLFAVLRSHYEDTPFDKSEHYRLGSPHIVQRAICARSTQYGLVAQLRAKLPPAVGNVLWISFYHPCTHPFVPVYSGVLHIPASFDNGLTPGEALMRHFEAQEESAPSHSFLHFVRDGKQVDKNYEKQISTRKNSLQNKERSFIRQQKETEKNVLRYYRKDKAKALTIITEATDGFWKVIWD